MRGSCLRACLARPLQLARAKAALAAPRAHPLPRRWDGRKRQGGALEDPWGLGHHWARREGALGDAPLDHRGTAPYLPSRLGARQPVVPLGKIREPLVIPDTHHTVRPPGFARPCPRAQAIECGRHGQGAADLGEFPDALKNIARGGPAMLPRHMARHA